MYKFKSVALAKMAACLIVCSLMLNPAYAHELPLLKIQMQETDSGAMREIALSLEDLKALPTVSFTTTTNWTSGPQAFTGVPLLALLDSLGISSGQLEMFAINEYSITVPVEEPTNEGALIAYLMNGDAMTARDKGPLWLVYDYDSDPKYRTETIYSRSIWQLDRIAISR